MKKIVLFIFLVLFILPCANAFSFNKVNKAELYLTSFDPRSAGEFIQQPNQINVFKTNEKIYFTVINKKGFKSDFIKYQIVYQDENAHVGGYSRVVNKIVRVSDKNYYIDYITLSKKGKYFIQIFDIENLQQWIVMGAFALVDE